MNFLFQPSTFLGHMKKLATVAVNRVAKRQGFSIAHRAHKTSMRRCGSGRQLRSQSPLRIGLDDTLLRNRER